MEGDAPDGDFQFICGSGVKSSRGHLRAVVIFRASPFRTGVSERLYHGEYHDPDHNDERHLIEHFQRF